MSNALNVIRAIGVRMILVCHMVLAYWRVSVISDNYLNLLWLLLLLLFLPETGYSLCKRKGKEWKWACPCLFLYLLSIVPAIWNLELDRQERYSEVHKNSTDVEHLSEILGVRLPIRLSPNIWVSVIEQSTLFLAIAARWALPRGKITREEISELLLMYVPIGSDMVELFELFEEPQIRQHKTFTYFILLCWTLSLLQFALVLTASREGTANESLCDKFISKRIWSHLVSFLLQDIPFLIIRLYVLIVYNLVTYSIIFFTCKNILVILLLVYRFLILC